MTIYDNGIPFTDEQKGQGARGYDRNILPELSAIAKNDISVAKEKKGENILNSKMIYIILKNNQNIFA